ncbi:MAG: hypothetical protein ABII12_16070 [Planctomycetota bacterium]
MTDSQTYWKFTGTDWIGDVRRFRITEDGGKMLTAVSAELPAYLLPPKAGAEGRPTSVSESGPDVRVSVSTRGATAAQAQPAGNGLYGPDGRFVEAAAQRTGQHPATQEQSGTDAVAYDGASSGAWTTPHARHGQFADSAADTRQTLLTLQSRESHVRDLGLSDFDAIIPPAAREELRSLADRVERKTEGANLDANEYRQMAELMSRVGRHDEAMNAIAKAEELEKGRQSDEPRETSQSRPDTVAQEAGAAEDTEG